MKKLMTALLWLVAVVASANDGVFYVNGSHLVPLKETDIAVTKEVLTISLCDDGYAKVDVQYEFTNRGAAKTVNVGFEAQAPYNDDYERKLDTSGRHPHIKDFTVTMNGTKLSYNTALVKSGTSEEVSNFKPLDLKKWRVPTGEDAEAWGNNLQSVTNKDTYINFSCAYYFSAAFKAGKNTIHHTYRYKMSSGVGRAYEVPYWLLPALRWANGQIDDFTLRIKAEKTAKYFSINPEPFSGAQFVVTQGKGKVRTAKTGWGGSRIEVTLRNGVVEWHKRNFRPSGDLYINSADASYSLDEMPVGFFYDRGGNFVFKYSPLTAEEKRIVRNLPYASRGYVFKDAKLKAYFAKLWWYMPDPSWQQDTSDFTKEEWRMINENK